jgi:hypothetical protein
MLNEKAGTIRLTPRKEEDTDFLKAQKIWLSPHTFWFDVFGSKKHESTIFYNQFSL